MISQTAGGNRQLDEEEQEDCRPGDELRFSPRAHASHVKCAEDDARGTRPTTYWPIVVRSAFDRWWLEELRGDPAYESIVTPLLMEVLQPQPRSRYLDLGCGEGRVMRALIAAGARAHGVDLSLSLVLEVTGHAAVADVRALPLRSGVYDGALCVLTLEHVSDHSSVFREAARVTRPGGVFAMVLNHPVWTAPESTPITDSDGEVLWRPGEYFSTGYSVMTTDAGTVTFFHRTMSDLLNAAATAGWRLERMIELPHHEFTNQSGIPRLLACRWELERCAEENGVNP